MNGLPRLKKVAALLLIGLWIAFVAIDPLDGILSPVDGIAVRSTPSPSAKLAANTHAVVEDDGQPQASPSAIAVLDSPSHSGTERPSDRSDTDRGIFRVPFSLYKRHVHFLI